MSTAVRCALIFVVIASSSISAGDNRAPRLETPPAPVSGLGDPDLDRCWHLDKIGAPAAWRMTQGTRDVTIAIVDSGINYNHPDLARNIRWNRAETPADGRDSDGNDYVDDVIGWDYVQGNHLPYDRAGHGTFLAGLIGATRDNGIGIPGVCPQCTMLPVRFLNYEGLGDTEDAIEGLYYAVRQGVSIINLSFAGDGYDADLEAAIRFAAQKDVLVVVSASNDGENLDRSSTYPGKLILPNMITVAASRRDDSLWAGSNWGKKTVALAAPGDNLYSTYFDDYADEGNGTSVATAVVSGAAGLVRSANRNLTAAQTKQILMSSTRKVPAMRGKSVTEGILDVAAAVACARQVQRCIR